LALTKAAEEKSVAERGPGAAKDQASAILARQKAEAGFWTFKTPRMPRVGKRQSSIGGDGEAYARFVLYQKLGPAFQNIMINTADSPLMEIFRNFNPSRSTERNRGSKHGKSIDCDCNIVRLGTPLGALRSFRVDRQSHLRAGRKKPATPLQGPLVFGSRVYAKAGYWAAEERSGFSKNFVAPGAILNARSGGNEKSLMMC